MKFEFENLGVLRKAEIELNDLTLICGKNNTGKTYTAYAIYGFLKSFRRLDIGLLTQEQIDKLAQKESLELDLDSLFFQRWPKLLDRMGEIYRHELPSVLAMNPDLFKSTRVRIDIPVPKNLVDEAVDISISTNGSGPLFGIYKSKNSTLLRIDRLAKVPYPPNYEVREFIIPKLMDYLFGSEFKSVFMASSERTGAAIFRNELNFSRTRLLEALASIEQSKKITLEKILPAIFPEFNPRYAFPIRDDVDFVNQLDDLAGDTSELVLERPEILKDFQDILGGEFRIVKKEVYFMPKKSRGFRLTLRDSSSSVRSLLDFGFYLQHRACRGDLVMIDEPELNLHPQNQRKMARLIGRLVNEGIRVFLTTHSDYLAKEINTMLLLGRLGATVASKYDYKDGELLRSEQINLYISQTRKTRKSDSSKRATPAISLQKMAPLSDGGFEYPSFDDTIDEMNNQQRSIWELINE